MDDSNSYFIWNWSFLGIVLKCFYGGCMNRKIVIGIILFVLFFNGCGKEDETSYQDVESMDSITQNQLGITSLEEYIQCGWVSSYVAGKIAEQGIEVECIDEGYYVSVDGTLTFTTSEDQDGEAYLRVSLTPSSEALYSVYGVYCGMTMIEADNILASQGGTARKLEYEELGIKIYRYELFDKYIIDINPNEEYVGRIDVYAYANKNDSLEKETFVIDKDINEYMIAEEVCMVLKEQGIDLVSALDGSYVNEDGSIKIYTAENSYGCVIYLTYSKNATYVLHGFYCGMSKQELDSIVEENNFPYITVLNRYRQYTVYDEYSMIFGYTDDEKIVSEIKCSFNSLYFMEVPNNMTFDTEIIENIEGCYEGMDTQSIMRIDMTPSKEDNLTGYASLALEGRDFVYEGELIKLVENVYLLESNIDKIIISFYTVNMNDYTTIEVEVYVNDVLFEIFRLNE